MTLALDNTILRTTARCSTEVTLRHVHGLTSEEDSAALAAGTAAHEALAVCMRGGVGGLGVFDSLYRQYSHEHKLSQDPRLQRLSWENTRAVLARWFEVRPAHTWPFVAIPELVEVAFELPLDDAGDFVFTGRLDAIVRDKAHGQLYVLDHKTTGRIDSGWAGAFRLDSQMSGYVWAAQETLGERVAGVYINGIEFAKLPSSDRKCKDHGVQYAECSAEHAKFELLQFDRSPDQLATWRQTALQLANKFANLKENFGERESLTTVPHEGTFHGACRYCQFSEFCAAGRPVNSLDALFIHRPWTPLPEKGSVVDVVA